MPTFLTVPVFLGDPAEFAGVEVAPRLPDPASRLLGRKFQRDLPDFPVHFVGTVRLPGFPLIRLQWVALCKTAGILLLRSGRIDPDVFSLLLNGLESEDEMALIRQHAPPFWPHWQKVLDADRPLAVYGHYRPSRMRDSAVSTVLGAFANAYFAQFGTSGE